MSDQDRISPHNINSLSNRLLTRRKKNINWGLIQQQILRTNIIRIVWKTVKRITEEIMGVNGFTFHGHLETFPGALS